MARIAKKDTFGIEHVGGGIDVRRRVVAGQRVPDHYDVPDSDVASPDETSVYPSGYAKEQVTPRVGSDGRVKRSAERDEAPVGVAEAEEAQSSRRSRGGRRS